MTRCIETENDLWVAYDTETKVSCVATSKVAAIAEVERINLLNVITKLEAENRRLWSGLNHICEQYLTEEMREPEHADYETGYTKIIKFARNILKPETPTTHENQ